MSITTRSLTNIIDDIKNYWGITPLYPDGEVVFPITKEQILRLQALSPTNQVALKVENIANKNIAFISWIAYDGSLVDTATVHYKVLSSSVITDLTTLGCITARFAKIKNVFLPTEHVGDLYIFLNKTKDLVPKRGGGGGYPSGASGTILG